MSERPDARRMNDKPNSRMAFVFGTRADAPSEDGSVSSTDEQPATLELREREPGETVPTQNSGGRVS